MTMNPLPPQAYTKETLGKAFAWLQAQSDSIKEMATSPDILVSLYLKAKLNGDGYLERPSIQNFKNELKSLAGMMGEFEVLDSSAAAEARVHQELPRVEAGPLPRPAAEHRPSSEAARPTAESKAQHHHGTLDARSATMIHEVKTEFNLSSDAEALRLLISAGFKSLKKL